MSDEPYGPKTRHQQEQENRQKAEHARSQRRGIVVRAIVATLGLMLVAVLLIDWNAIRFQGTSASTIDAELRGNPVRIEARVAGYITHIGTDDDQPVRAGQLLYEIEQDTYRVQVAQNTAMLHQTQAQLGELEARIAAQQATIASQFAVSQSTQAGVVQTGQELARQNALRGTEGGVQRDWQQASADARQNRDNLAANQDQLRAAQAQLTVLQAQRVQAQAQYAARAAQLSVAQINLGYTRIVAPADGFVTQRLGFVGTYVMPGRQLLTFVPYGVWAVGDYREEALAAIAVGQPAELHVDAIPGVRFRGHVQSIGPASQSRQSALPPDRATGNFTKVVQRVPVKVTFDPGQVMDRLLPGLSVEIRIFTPGS